MIISLKLLGLIIVAVLAMDAVVASTAQATPEFTASSYPATLTGSNSFGNEDIKTEAGDIQCNSHFVSNSLSTQSQTLTLTPTYTNCQSFGFMNATFSTEGCAYVLHATEKVATSSYAHHMDISCPEGKSMKILSGTCKAEIKPQTGLTTVTTVNLASSITLEWEMFSMSLVVTQDGFGCPFSGTGTKTLTYTGHIILSRVGGGSASVSGS